MRHPRARSAPASKEAAASNEAEVPTADDAKPALIVEGHVRCRQFPFVVMTSNGERDFPAAFLRRCVQVKIENPDRAQLEAIVRAHLGAEMIAKADDLIAEFDSRVEEDQDLANDQLLNAIHLLKAVHPTRDLTQGEYEKLVKLLFKPLNEAPLP